MRRRWKRIGPLKIHRLLSERYGGRRKLPAVSTIALVLKRHGMIKKRRRVRRIREVHPIFEAKGPNEIWSVDFKGEFRLGDGRYCSRDGDGPLMLRAGGGGCCTTYEARHF
jgi:transposase InsO family protein